MTFTIRVTIRQAERSLERLLNVIGRRGYRVRELRAESVDDDSIYIARCQLVSDRAPEVLVNFIDKLYDVEHVCLENRSDNVAAPRG